MMEMDFESNQTSVDAWQCIHVVDGWLLQVTLKVIPNFSFFDQWVIKGPLHCFSFKSHTIGHLLCISYSAVSLVGTYGGREHMGKRNTFASFLVTFYSGSFWARSSLTVCEEYKKDESKNKSVGIQVKNNIEYDLCQIINCRVIHRTSMSYVIKC